MHKRERSWIIGLTAIYFCLAVLLVNPAGRGPGPLLGGPQQGILHRLARAVCHHDRLRADVDGRLHGHALSKFRFWGMIGGAAAVILALYCLADAAAKLYVGPGGEAISILSQLPHLIAQAFARDQYGLPIFANLILVAMPIIFLIALLVYRNRGPVLILLGLCPDHAGLFRPVPLVQERTAQPLVRLLVRARHVHAAVRHLSGDDAQHDPVWRHRSRAVSARPT